MRRFVVVYDIADNHRRSKVLAPPLFGERRRHLYSRHMYMEREVNGIPLLRY